MWAQNPQLVIVMGVLLVAFVVGALVRHRERRMEHEEILKALEEGAEIVRPRTEDALRHLRTGTLCIALAFGIFFFFWYARGSLEQSAWGHRMEAIAFIPLFLGIGFLINHFLEKRSAGNARNSAERTQNPLD
jgi:preprotein translocase subunit YajC